MNYYLLSISANRLNNNIALKNCGIKCTISLQYDSGTYNKFGRTDVFNHLYSSTLYVCVIRFLLIIYWHFTDFTFQLKNKFVSNTSRHLSWCSPSLTLGFLSCCHFTVMLSAAWKGVVTSEDKYPRCSCDVFLLFIISRRSCVLEEVNWNIWDLPCLNSLY